MFNQPTQSAHETKSSLGEPNRINERKPTSGGVSQLSQILSLQKTIGNQATSRLIQQKMQAAQAKRSTQASSNSNQPIQRMTDEDYKTKFSELTGAKGFSLLGKMSSFQQFLTSVTSKAALTYIRSDEFTEDMLKDYVKQFIAYDKTFALEKQNKIADVTVPQGMYMVASQSELEAGLTTDGAGPCVCVGIQVKLSDSGATDILALSHFDSETDPKMFNEMFQAACDLAGEEAMSNNPEIIISLAGGQDDMAQNESGGLSGSELFAAVEKLATAKGGNVKVIKRRTLNNDVINTRLDADKGMKRFKDTMIDPQNPQDLIDNPEALAATKLAIEKGKLLKNPDNEPTEAAKNNFDKMKKAVEEASNAQ